MIFCIPLIFLYKIHTFNTFCTFAFSKMMLEQLAALVSGKFHGGKGTVPGWHQVLQRASSGSLQKWAASLWWMAREKSAQHRQGLRERIKFFGAKWRRHSLDVSLAGAAARPLACVSSAHNLSTELSHQRKNKGAKTPSSSLGAIFDLPGVFSESHTLTPRRCGGWETASAARPSNENANMANVFRTCGRLLFVTSANVTKWKSVGTCEPVNGVKSR